MRVAELMTSNVSSVRSDESLSTAALPIWESDCGAIPVRSPENDKVTGVITDRDICMAAWTKGQAIENIPIANAVERSDHLLASRLDRPRCIVDAEAQDSPYSCGQSGAPAARDHLACRHCEETWARAALRVATPTFRSRSSRQPSQAFPKSGTSRGLTQRRPEIALMHVTPGPGARIASEKRSTSEPCSNCRLGMRRGGREQLLQRIRELAHDVLELPSAHRIGERGADLAHQHGGALRVQVEACCHLARDRLRRDAEIRPGGEVEQQFAQARGQL